MQRIRDKRFLITGVSRFPANKIVKFLCTQRINVVGLDIRFPTYHPPNMKFYETDHYFSNIQNIVKNESIDVVIHLMFDYDIYSDIHPYNRNNFIRFERLLRLYREGLIRQLFIFSSIFVYGVNFSNDNRFIEEDTLLASSNIAYLNDMIVIDRYIQNFLVGNDYKGLFVFRIAPLYHDFSEEILIRFFKKTPVLFSISKRDPSFQFLYINDLANYIINATISGKGGIFNIATADSIRLSEIAKLLNKLLVYVPEGLLRGIFGTYRWISQSDIYNSELLDILSFPCPVSIDKARSILGYEPEYGCKEIVENITFFD
ncbi:MAG: NAD-dependent epimerase/dehydratase family protein [Myxococcota bacterium]